MVSLGWYLMIAAAIGIAILVKIWERDMLEGLRMQGFDIRRKIRIGPNYALVAIDSRRLAICQNWSWTPILNVPFAQVKDSEIKLDHWSYTKKRVGSTVSRSLIGSLIMGPMGMLVGALTTPTEKIEGSNNGVLKIYLYDMERVSLKLPIFGPRTSMVARKQAMAGAEQLHDLIHILTDVQVGR